MANTKQPDSTKKRYEPLGDFLRGLDVSESVVTLSFDEVAEIIDHHLPESATKHHHQWWANQAYGSRAPHWTTAGFKVTNVNLPDRLVRFERVTNTPGITLLNPALQEIASAVNEHARGRPIGTLQEWRKKQKDLTRVPSRTIFYSEVDPDRHWVFHAGGLSELQFNLGFEDVDRQSKLRYGVAFSLQPTREMPNIDPLIPKIERFNEFLRIYPNAFAGLSMWHWEEGRRSANYAVSQIPDDRIRPDVFIFIGTLQGTNEVRIDWILDDFDHLLVLHKYVEGSESFPRDERVTKGFVWTPGNRSRVTRTSFERLGKSVDKQLRHNAIQPVLFNFLVGIHGEENVSGEQDSGIGTSVDVAVKNGKQFTYFEIKTGLSAQSCIREALGQLLEYSYWPGNQSADKLVIVGEAKYDAKAKAYIKNLQSEFALPIEYRRFDMKSRRLV